MPAESRLARALTELKALSQECGTDMLQRKDPGGCRASLSCSGEFGGTTSAACTCVYLSVMSSRRRTKSRHSFMITRFDSMVCVRRCYIRHSGIRRRFRFENATYALVLNGNSTTNAKYEAPSRVLATTLSTAYAMEPSRNTSAHGALRVMIF